MKYLILIMILLFVVSISVFSTSIFSFGIDTTFSDTQIFGLYSSFDYYLAQGVSIFLAGDIFNFGTTSGSNTFFIGSNVTTGFRATFNLSTDYLNALSFSVGPFFGISFLSYDDYSYVTDSYDLVKGIGIPAGGIFSLRYFDFIKHVVYTISLRFGGIFLETTSALFFSIIFTIGFFNTKL